MLTKEEFLRITKQYDLDKSGVPREDYKETLIPSLKRKEILILKGVRRCGKTTILKQLIQHLKANGVKAENILYVNFDDFNFLPHLSFELLELMLSTRNLKEKQYLFLDEIQKIPQFESWLKTYYDREINAKFIISGSNSSLLAKDFATLLTGRNLTHEIFPLTYNEYKLFKPDGTLSEYMEYGGFPEVVLETNKEQKLNLLRNYVSDIVNKDIFQRRAIRNQQQLLTIIQYVLSNPGIKLSINKLATLTKASKDTVSKYLEYMIDAYLLIEVAYFSFSVKARFHQTQSPKYYALDNGFYRVNTTRTQQGNLCENMIANTLRRTHEQIAYWSEGKSEVDFVVEETAINVTTATDIPSREARGLEEIKKKHKRLKKFIILNPTKKEKKENLRYVKIEDFLQE